MVDSTTSFGCWINKSCSTWFLNQQPKGLFIKHIPKVYVESSNDSKGDTKGIQSLALLCFVVLCCSSNQPVGIIPAESSSIGLKTQQQPLVVYSKRSPLHSDNTAMLLRSFALHCCVIAVFLCMQSVALLGF